MESGLVMSAVTHRLLPAGPSFAVSSSMSSRRPTSTTVKPAFINASDAARPTPVPAPVTSAILLVICFVPVFFLREVFLSEVPDHETCVVAVALQFLIQFGIAHDGEIVSLPKMN